LQGSASKTELRKRGVDIWAEWADDAHKKKFNRAAGDLGPVFYEITKQYS